VALSLQDQLKKSGLVDEKKAKQLERAKRKESKQPPQKKTVQKNVKQEAELARKKLRLEQIERDRKLMRSATATANGARRWRKYVSLSKRI